MWQGLVWLLQEEQAGTLQPGKMLMGDMKTVEAGAEILDVFALVFLLCLRLLATAGRQDLGLVGVNLT